MNKICKFLLTVSYIMILVVSLSGCTEKHEHEGDETVNHNYYDNTTKNSSRTNVASPLVYQSSVECWIVGLDGVLVSCN